jgi:hypothetical protein
VVTERDHTLVPVAPAGPAIPVEGVPDGVDLEALAFIGPATFLLGTERHADRSTDTVLEGRITDGRAQVTGQRVVDYAALGLSVEPNQGIEGLCAAGEHIVLAVETPIVEGGERFAPLIADGVVVRLRLGSPTGKISAIACAEGGVVWAIERHYGVSRVLRARLDGARIVVPELWTNLAAIVPDPIPNFEGIAVRGAELWLVNDDQPSPAGTRTRVVRMVSTSTRGGS